MDRTTRTNLGFGFLLILIGGLFLAIQLVPGLNWVWSIFTWPMWIVGVGVFLLLLGLLLGAPGMAIPAVIVGGIGGLLYWQNATGNWESWAYAWSLIPGFVGVGLMLASILGEGGKNGFRVGTWMAVISFSVFAVFSGIFGNSILGDYWPVGLILFGLWLLVQPLFRRKTIPNVVSDPQEHIDEAQ
ncbi:MAG: hypothetical protein H8E28_00805 [Anaerolineae bacterium]|nr:hypothetical protein [Anaerolineae bacterium]